MKKILSLLLAATVLFCCFGITAFADEATATIYVSIADKGNLKVGAEDVWRCVDMLYGRCRTYAEGTQVFGLYNPARNK